MDSEGLHSARDREDARLLCRVRVDRTGSLLQPGRDAADLQHLNEAAGEARRIHTRRGDECPFQARQFRAKGEPRCDGIGEQRVREHQIEVAREVERIGARTADQDQLLRLHANALLRCEVGI